MPDVDWDGLRTAAVDIMQRAYAPYSRFKVGVAGLVDDGRIVADGPRDKVLETLAKGQIRSAN